MICLHNLRQNLNETNWKQKEFICSEHTTMESGEALKIKFQHFVAFDFDKFGAASAAVVGQLIWTKHRAQILANDVLFHKIGYAFWCI
jgi:hypothetical protein